MGGLGNGPARTNPSTGPFSRVQRGRKRPGVRPETRGLSRNRLRLLGDAKCRVRVMSRESEMTPSAYDRAVGNYRLHYLDGIRGDIVSVREFEAEGDEAAFAYGEYVRSLTAMELWEGDRKVMHWDAFPSMGN